MISAGERAGIAGHHRRQHQPKKDAGAKDHIPNMRRLPVVVTSTLSPICAVASWTKLSPLQCIGISTSGSHGGDHPAAAR
jgi:hypothetical protein